LLSTTERRFIRYWEEQRTGGRWSYYALYILVGTLLATIILSTFLFLFFRVLFGSITFWVALFAALLISSLSTALTWAHNEKKFKNIIRREMEGKKLPEDQDR